MSSDANLTATPSSAPEEGKGEAAMLDTVERLGSWRTNGMYDIGLTHRLTGVPARSIKHWLEGYPGHVAKLKSPWKTGRGRKWTNLTKISFLELTEVLVAGEIRKGRRNRYDEVREFHDSVASEWGTQFPFAHQKMHGLKEQLPIGAVTALWQLEYEDDFAARWYPLGKIRSGRFRAEGVWRRPHDQGQKSKSAGHSRTIRNRRVD